MCGIVGYIGQQEATQVLLKGLSCLEYRGYDSAGLSVFEGESIRTTKAAGRIANLCALLKGKQNASCGIAHTRWATHGEPSDVNAHPHNTEALSLVHNGIIENYLPLRQMLMQQGYCFCSQTDTEVAAKLLDFYYQKKQHKGNPLSAIQEAIAQMEGSFAFGILFADFPQTIYAVRRDSPLIVAVGEGEAFIASDIPAILPYTNRYFILEEGEIGMLQPDGVTFFDADLQKTQKELLTSTLTVSQAEKEGYAHFMLKEIHEQPLALHKTLTPRIVDGLPCFEHDHIPDSLFAQAQQLHIVACGSAYYAGMVGKYATEQLARLPVTVNIASEFRYSNPILRTNDVVIVLSQSGETADSLAALRLAKSKGVPTLAIVNVAGSSIAREADFVILTDAGPEIAVATTKGYAVQVGTLYLVALKAALMQGQLDATACRKQMLCLLDAVEKTKEVFALDSLCKSIGDSFLDVTSMFYMGRGQDYCMSVEGALKLKEISYIQCEAYPAGELKHGTISLITAGTPVITLATNSRLQPKTISNIREVKSRGGRIIALCTTAHPLPAETADTLVMIPPVAELFAPLVAMIPLQLIAYYAACAKGCDVDKPRNLAKSVTVE